LLLEVARLATDADRLEEASGLLDQAEALSKTVRSPPWTNGRLEQQRGVVAILRDDVDGASAIASQALARPTTSLARSRLLNLIGLVAVERSAFDEARQATEESLAIARESGNLAAEVVDLCNLAEIALRAGHHQAAAQHQLASLTLAQQLGAVREASSALVVAARLAAAADEWAPAARLQAAADAVMSRIGVHLYPTDRALSDALLATAAARLGPDRYDVEHEAGSNLAIDEAITAARSVLEAQSGEPVSAPR
jgi:ATP/maltotriose-dependent transcriptional regulator MalT